MPRIAPVAGIALLLLAAGLPARAGSDTRGGGGGPAYPLYGFRPHRKGEVSRFEASVAMLRTATSRWDAGGGGGGRPRVDEDEAGGHVVGTCEVLGVRGRGYPTGLAVTVESFTQTDGKVTREALPPGTRVLVGLEGKRTAFSVDGKPVGGTPGFLLSRVFRLYPADFPVDADAMLGGAGTPRHVGDAWPVNAKAMAASSRYYGNTVDESAITGTVRLTGVESVDGRPCLSVGYDFDVASYAPAAGTGNARPSTGPTAERAAAEGHGRYLLPVDPGAACVRRSSSYTNRRTVTNLAAGGRRYTTEYVTREQTAFRLLPPAPATRPAATRASTRRAAP